ncbi:MAG: 4Fe-4S dicluster domain-containing protein [Candidatus Abyssobacteria bacterium SURF_5]|uniref:Ferredoxin n=1 Tax=Abyssobacteria bacterium (strain SURF_5) TaxID=2093360 RepID=A0A3A4NYH7_ABYX5|nr:MAG: 4Fe-4S dicluster domain-containing protein [Candidatus Abyssubacteria bacterium SURF_5]
MPVSHQYPLVDKELCIGCGNCQLCCPAEPNVFEIRIDEGWREDKSFVINPDSCIECALCVNQCPVQAITLVGPDTE